MMNPGPNYMYAPDLLGTEITGAVRGFWWCEKHEVKAKIVKAEPAWLHEHHEELFNASPVATEFPPVDADERKYVWLKSRPRPIAEAPAGVRGGEIAHCVEVPAGLTFIWAGGRGDGAYFGVWVETAE